MANIFKYGYGLLGLNQEDLYAMDCEEFLERVEGCLSWQQDRLFNYDKPLQDSLLDYLAWFSANIMHSSGNFKKGTNPDEIRKGFYLSEQEIKEEQSKDKVKDVKAEKEKLARIFNLDVES